MNEDENDANVLIPEMTMDDFERSVLMRPEDWNGDWDDTLQAKFAEKQWQNDMKRLRVQAGIAK